jgi:hypothetical protein
MSVLSPSFFLCIFIESEQFFIEYGCSTTNFLCCCPRAKGFTPVCFHRRRPSFPAAADCVRTPALAGPVKSSIFDSRAAIFHRQVSRSPVPFRRVNQQRVFPSPRFRAVAVSSVQSSVFRFWTSCIDLCVKIDFVSSCLSCREQLLWFNDFHSHLSSLSHGFDFHFRSQWQAFSFADCSSLVVLQPLLEFCWPHTRIFQFG